MVGLSVSQDMVPVLMVDIATSDEFPNAVMFHTIRVNQPAGWYYTTDSLRKICDIWEKYGSGLTNMHGSTGDIILLGTTTENLQPCFNALTEAGFDLKWLRFGIANHFCMRWPVTL